MYYTSGEAIVQGDYKLIVGGVMQGPFGGAGMLFFCFVFFLLFLGLYQVCFCSLLFLRYASLEFNFQLAAIVCDNRVHQETLHREGR